MGLEAITQSDAGATVVVSNRDEWSEWVSATSTRNFLLQDPILDWLDLYGECNGFQPDFKCPGYDPATDFNRFLFEKAKEFEQSVIVHLRSLTTTVTIRENFEDVQNLDKAKATFEAMKCGQKVIWQAVLWDANTRTYGVPDFLIRSDELSRLFPNILGPEEANVPARDLGKVSWHYRVVDIKYTTLDLAAGGELDNGGSSKAYKAQLYIYNRALGRYQGYLPPVSYLMGRSWKQTLKGVTSRGTTCMERLAPVSHNSIFSKGRSLSVVTDEAVDWVRKIRSQGSKWTVLPNPTISELRPNMGNTQDSPWHVAKKKIAGELAELTLLWFVGVEKRQAANQVGIHRWEDPKCTAQSIGITGDKTEPILQAILGINQSKNGSPVAPKRIASSENVWRVPQKLDFYVDFETVTDLDDDFSLFPAKGGTPVIFMIGCGHVEDGSWRYRCFTADALTGDAEREIIDSWVDHMRATRQRFAGGDREPLLIHWSAAETSNLQDAYNAAIKRHPEREKDWLRLQWFDFLKNVIKAEPVVVRGALAFGLKPVAQAMYNRGLIKTNWEDGPVDGLGAMVGAWWCAKEAARSKIALNAVPFMKKIAAYNEVDCKVMMEIVCYLRQNH
jgi:hypothetical protein